MGGLTQRGFLSDLDDPSKALAHMGPNWFAAVMGTGIVAVAGATLPVSFPGQRAFTTAVWVLACLLLAAVSVAWALHWLRFRDRARTHIYDPVQSQFLGAPPMAIMVVGVGAVYLGPDVIGQSASLRLAWGCWAVGIVLGIGSAVAVPYMMFTRRCTNPHKVFGGWLMPLVPPLIGASLGSALLPYAPAGQAQLAMALLCYAMFGMSVVASFIIFPILWSSLVQNPSPPAVLVPTMWIVLGPLGQSVTVANNLGAAAAKTSIAGSYENAVLSFGVLYGVPMWGFAALWFMIAVATTVHTMRQGMPFALTWWSFTFPVGVCVTATSALAGRVGSTVLNGVAAALYAFLVAAWLVVTVRTFAGTYRGRLLMPPAKPAPAP